MLKSNKLRRINPSGKKRGKISRDVNITLNMLSESFMHKMEKKKEKPGFNSNWGKAAVMGFSYNCYTELPIFLTVF